MDEKTESLCPRESTRPLRVGSRTVTATLTEMTIRQQNLWEDACIEVDKKTLLSIESNPNTNDILQIRSDLRATVLPMMISLKPEDGTLTESELQSLRFSVVEQIFLTQAQLNRRSDVVGEVQNLLNRVAQQVPTSSAQVTSVLEANPSSDGSGSSSSAIPLEPTTA